MDVHQRVRAEKESELTEAEAAEFASQPGILPVPPMPGETFEFTPRARQTVPSAVAVDDALRNEPGDAQEAPRA